jgi:F0F1-type ATP synthase membrane subunit b/b'
MPNEQTIEEQLSLAKKLEKAMKERTEQIQAALLQSQKELAQATAKREALEAKMRCTGQ